MKFYMVYCWDRFDHGEYCKTYFLNRSNADAYLEKMKIEEPYSYWELDEIYTEDSHNEVGVLED